MSTRYLSTGKCTVVCVCGCVHNSVLHACTLFPLEILRVRFHNGEENMVEIKNVEPADDFLPPCTGSTVCCKVKGGKYSAEILAIENVVPKQCKVHVLIGGMHNGIKYLCLLHLYV